MVSGNEILIGRNLLYMERASVETKLSVPKSQRKAEMARQLFAIFLYIGHHDLVFNWSKKKM